MRTASFNETINFTRPGTATYTGSDGLLKTAAADQPRFDYSTGKRGLLLEPPATNLLPDSGFASGLSGKVIGGAVTAISGDYWAGVSNNGIQFAAPAPASYSGVFIPTTTASGSYCLSVFVVMDDGGAPVFGSSIGGASANDFCLAHQGAPINPLTYKVQPLVGGVYRVSAAYTATGSEAGFGLIKYENANTRGFKVTGYQYEAGPFPTSYIQTGASAVTRPADKAQLADPVAALLRRGEVTVLVQGEGMTGAWGRLLSGPSSNDYIGVIEGVESGQIFAGYPNLGLASGLPLPLPDFGVTVGWDAGVFRGAYNGGPVLSRSGTQEADLSEVYLGRTATGGFAPGIYYQLVIWPFRMTDADLQAKAVPHV